MNKPSKHIVVLVKLYMLKEIFHDVLCLAIVLLLHTQRTPVQILFFKVLKY